MLVLIDYGAGNLRAVAYALAAVGAHAVVTDDPEEVRAADRIVLPGVEAFAAALRARESLVAAIEKVVSVRATPILCVCVGMQRMPAGVRT